MAKSLSILVDEALAGLRLDVALTQAEAYESRSQAAKQIEAGRVFLNGVPAQKRLKVELGDTIVYEEIPDERHVEMIGEAIPLDVRYDDESLLVLSKQAGLCVHPSPGHETSTLVHALIFKYGRDNLAHVQGDDRPGIVHRLDMDTSGLMICAHTDEAGNLLQDMIRLRSVDRHYICLVHGNIAHDTGMIDQPLARMDHERLKMGISYKDSARQAITTFSVLERFEAGVHDEGYTLVECKLYTGRTHQIRVHMHYIRHALVGDPLYSFGSSASQMGLTRQFLHSYSLGFEHPSTHNELHFVDALPPDLDEVLTRLADRSMGRTARGEEVFELLSDAPRQSEDLVPYPIY